MGKEETKHYNHEQKLTIEVGHDKLILYLLNSIYALILLLVQVSRNENYKMLWKSCLTMGRHGAN